MVSAHFAVCLHLPFIVSTNNCDWRNKAKKPGSLEVELNDYLPGVLVALTVYLLSQQQRAGSRQTRKEEEEEEEDEDESEEDVDEDEDDTDDEN